ncbi:MAG: RDD family protein [Tissierellia bacterium]|nr:RDD family protein [Tissierellia bacterium]
MNEVPREEQELEVKEELQGLEHPSTSNDSIYKDIGFGQPKEKADRIHEEYGNWDEFIYAGFWIRLIAFIFDLLVVSALRGILLSPIKLKLSPLSFGYEVLSIFVLLLYFVLMTKLNQGQTLGKMLLGLKVVSLRHHELTWWDVLTREFFSRYILQKVMILYIIAAFAPKKQHIGDMLSDTTVIKVEMEELIRHVQMVS